MHSHAEVRYIPGVLLLKRCIANAQQKERLGAHLRYDPYLSVLQKVVVGSIMPRKRICLKRKRIIIILAGKRCVKVTLCKHPIGFDLRACEVLPLSARMEIPVLLGILITKLARKFGTNNHLGSSCHSSKRTCFSCVGLNFSLHYSELVN